MSERKPNIIELKPVVRAIAQVHGLQYIKVHAAYWPSKDDEVKPSLEWRGAPICKDEFTSTMNDLYDNGFFASIRYTAL